MYFVFFKQKTAYEMRISDWSSDVCSSDLKFWPADLHIIGKDIVRFHAVYWPAFLISANLPLPKKIFGHGFLLNRGEKMSKSVGNVTDPLELAAAFGVDQLRYFLLREVSFGQDGSYSDEAIVTRTNAELANSFGNLAQRVLSLLVKNCGGVLPFGGEQNGDDLELQGKVADACRVEVPREFEALAFSHGIEAWLRSEEHTSELQSLMRISYAVFCLKT